MTEETKIEDLDDLSKTFKSKYMDNVLRTTCEANRYALFYKDRNAWINKKRKTWKLYTPRGVVFKRLLTMEVKALAKIVKAEQEVWKDFGSMPSTTLTTDDLAS
jgi:hypothetical protein